MPLRILPSVAAAEQHAVRHDGRADAVRLQDRQHVLDEHQVGLLAGLRGPAVAESLRVLHALLRRSSARTAGW